MPRGKIRIAEIYKMGRRMGFSPQEVNAMSTFQFSACVDGWIEDNQVDDANSLSQAEQDELWEWLQTKER